MFVDNAKIRFDRLFNDVENEIPYNSDWETGLPGYIPGAVDGPLAPIIKPGEYAKCTKVNKDPILFIGTSLGNLVIFRKYSTGYVWQYSEGIRRSMILWTRETQDLTEKDIVYAYNLQKILMSIEKQMLNPIV